MATIITSKELSGNQELIAVPRSHYEEFLAWQKAIKGAKTFKPSKADIQVLKKGRKNLHEGNYITLDELEHNR